MSVEFAAGRWMMDAAELLGGEERSMGYGRCQNKTISDSSSGSVVRQGLVKYSMARINLVSNRECNSSLHAEPRL